MGIFGRKPRRDGRDTTRDPSFEFFSEDEGARFRAGVHAAFAEQGLEVTVGAEAVTDSAGRQFGLSNLAAVCHNDARGPRVWPELTRRHIGIMLRAMDGPSVLDTMPAEKFRAQLYPRLLPDEMTASDGFDYARPLAEGLREVLALDLPESVMVLPRSSLEPFGDVAVLRARALENLRGLPVESHETIEQEEGARIDVVMGESMFTASLVLTLDELVPRITGRGLSTDGALVAVPFRHQLAFHAIRDRHVIAGLHTLAQFAAAGFEEGVGRITPDVYWWRAGSLTRLSTMDEGGIKVTVDGQFQAVLERLIEG